ncbi:MAG TPA: phosphoribosylglycinamide formyltransferase [Steroidobacteraceae bacterium]|nr:phosphoribosylglycinamide formyltransferase [Steroidobacteraceae bacterium]
MTAATELELAILISGRGSNMTALARACQAGTLPARVAVVIADREAAGGLGSARELGIATETVAPVRDTVEFERALEALIERYRPGALALAGFMRVLSASFVARYLGRIFNIHPSLLPKYRGLHTHRRVLEAHETEHGASVHFVTPELDAGPVVLQSRVRVHAGDTEASLAARVLATEHVIYPRALGWFAAGRLAWRDGGAWLDGRRLEAPVVEDFS